MTNFQVDTAESQVFGFYSNTGQGGTEGVLQTSREEIAGCPPGQGARAKTPHAR